MSHWTEEFFVDNPEIYLRELESMAEFAGNETASILSLLSSEFGYRPSSVLDVGCGTGRHCRAFAKEGLEVIGLDISPSYIDRAKEKAQSLIAKDRIQFYELDMRNLDRLDEQVELVVCLYNTFGYYSDQTNISTSQGVFG